MWMTLPSQNYYQNTPTPKCQIFIKSSLLSWANENDMEINTTKTKEMILGPLARSNLPFRTTPTGTIDMVTSFKLLGLHIDSSLSWANHATIRPIVQKASSRLYFLKQLKRAGLATHHLLQFYIAAIGPKTCT